MLGDYLNAGNCYRTFGRFRHGTSLIEVAFATAIVGLGVTALISFFAGVTRTNVALSEQTTGMSIARAAHEWAASKTFDELTGAFAASNPIVPSEPLGAGAGALYDSQRALTYAGLTQQLSMRRVQEANLSAADSTGTSRIVEVTVTVMKNKAQICAVKKLYAQSL